VRTRGADDDDDDDSDAGADGTDANSGDSGDTQAGSADVNTGDSGTGTWLRSGNELVITNQRAYYMYTSRCDPASAGPDVMMWAPSVAGSDGWDLLPRMDVQSYFVFVKNSAGKRSRGLTCPYHQADDKFESVVQGFRHRQNDPGY
jgi:hypothetical protein